MFVYEMFDGMNLFKRRMTVRFLLIKVWNQSSKELHCVMAPTRPE